MDSAKTVESLEYRIEPLHKKHGETETVAIQLMVDNMAAQGWELVEACGDEIRMPSLIFVKDANASQQKYLSETVPHVRGQGEVDDIRSQLFNRHDEGWIVLTVLDSPLSPPIAVYRKDVLKDQNENTAKLIILPVSILGNTSETVKTEITQQEIRNNCRLRSIMHSGLSPVLIFLQHTGQPEYEYLVEHARSGLFTGHLKKLGDLINARAKEGWKVCGAFEDESLLPCVVFYKEAAV
jgi:hypothetical protein